MIGAFQSQVKHTSGARERDRRVRICLRACDIIAAAALDGFT